MKQAKFNFDTLPSKPKLEVIRSNSQIIIIINDAVKYDFNETDIVMLRFVSVQLYTQFNFTQASIVKHLQISSKTLYNWISRYNESGINGLKDEKLGPPVKITEDVIQQVLKLREGRVKLIEISRMLNISHGSVCKILYAKPADTEDKLPGFNKLANDFTDDFIEEALPLSDSAPEDETAEVDFDNPELILSSETAVSVDPLNRNADRMFAALGLQEDAEPVFANIHRTEFTGVFLAIALLSKDIFFTQMKHVYKTMGGSFYGLRNTFMMLFIMAFLRIKNPEKSDQFNKIVLGRILGLDRAPSVKTIRRKIKYLTHRNKGSVFMDILAKERLDNTCEADAVLYVDGHVISYYGNRKLGKTFSTSKNKVTSASTEYWVNLADGTPILCIPTEFNSSMTTAFDSIMTNAGKVCRNRPITFVFDRGGCSAGLFDKIIKAGHNFIAYNKNSPSVNDENFIKEKTVINCKEHNYKPYSREIEKEIYKKDKNGRYRKTGKKVRLREVLIKRDDGRNTSIVTSGKDLESAAVAEIIFKRWTQENYFKYLREEYDFDHLCTYKMLDVDEGIDHPNPEYTELNKKIEKLNKRIEKIVGKQLKESVTDSESNKFNEDVNSLNTGEKGKELIKLRMALKLSKEAIKNVNPRISASEYERIDSESRLVTNIVKMTAYFIEGKLAKILSYHYKGVNGNERGIVSAMLKSSGSITVKDRQLIIGIEEQATPGRTRMLKAMCSEINAMDAVFPGTDLKMVFQLAESWTRGKNR